MKKGLNRGFRRNLSDVGLGEIRRQITYKADWNNRVISTVDRFFPSSKNCSNCGTKNTSLRLQDRKWTCPCGAHHDRDINAAINIQKEGLRLLCAPHSTASIGGTGGRSGTKARGDSCNTLTCNDVPVQVNGSLNRELVQKQPGCLTFKLTGKERLKRTCG